MEILLSAGTFFFIKKGLRYSNTAYALQTGGCEGKCRFCTQSILSKSDKTYLSRVKWYPVKLEEIADKFSNFKRFCLQTVIKRNFENEVIDVIKYINIPKSVTITPVKMDILEEMKKLGVDYLGIGLDTVESLWDKIGKPYTFQRYMEFIKDAIEIFGKRKVYVHLVFGLGENMEEFVSLMEKIYSLGGEVALFAFTPVKGTLMENFPRPSLEKYRKVQEIRFKLSTKGNPNEKAYLTSGCPGCDRPFYNEDPRGKLYNIPFSEEK
jgi:biotin synthase